MKPREIPVTECWRESYEQLADRAGFEYFPTRAYLKANPEKSQAFCHWLWRLLGKHEGDICEAEEFACRECQNRGLSKWTAFYVLAHIVRDADPGLFLILHRKSRQYQKSPGLKHPDDPLDPKGPLASRMPVPPHPVVTDAVARQLKDKPWIHRYL